MTTPTPPPNPPNPSWPPAGSRLLAPGRNTMDGVPQEYEAIPVPGHTGPIKQYVDFELLYSTAAFTQKGVTLKGGQGVLLLGTVLARSEVDKKYYPWESGGDDGLGIARGVLRRSVGLGGAGARDQVSNIVIQGILKLSYVHVHNPDADGDQDALDDAVLEQLNARIDVTRDTFTF